MLFWVTALIVLFATPVRAVECGNVTYKGQGYTVCEVDMATEEVRLFLNDPATGAPLGSFTNVDRQLAREGRHLVFAMNAGMYHQDRSPVGYFVEQGREFAPVISRDGPGNFGMLPNGIFCIGDGRADVYETRTFLAVKPVCRFATQSGPMLVIDGALHPRFLPDSDSRYRRNGVGTSPDGRRAWFVISDAPVTFYEFGSFFRDALKLRQALYFDGNISRLYAPALDRFDGGFPMGPMVGVLNPVIE